MLSEATVATAAVMESRTWKPYCSCATVHKFGSRPPSSYSDRISSVPDGIARGLTARADLRAFLSL
jgi:hypothetical protein